MAVVERSGLLQLYQKSIDRDWLDSFIKSMLAERWFWRYNEVREAV